MGVIIKFRYVTSNFVVYENTVYCSCLSVKIESVTLHCRWKEQDAYIDHLLSVLDSSSAAEVAKLKDSESKLQQRVEEFTRRENVLNMRLATKQQELQELVVRDGMIIYLDVDLSGT